jgi:hypothetical protein
MNSQRFSCSQTPANLLQRAFHVSSAATDW